MFSSASFPLKTQFWFWLPAILTTNWASEAVFHIKNNASIISFHLCRNFWRNLFLKHPKYPEWRQLWCLTRVRQDMEVQVSWSYLREKLCFVVETVAVVFTSDWHHLSCPVLSSSVSRTLDLLKLVHTPASHEREDCLEQSLLPFSLWWRVTYTVQ